MPGAEAKLTITAALEAARANAGLKTLTDKVNSANKEMKKADTATGGYMRLQGAVGRLVSTYAGLVAGVVAFGAANFQALKAYHESEKSAVRLKASVMAAEGSFSRYKQTLDDTIKTSSRMAAVDDELVSDALSRLVQMTGDVTEAQKLLAISMDVSRGTGKDLIQTATVIGKVHAGNVGALKKFGIVVDDSATSVEALGILQEKYAGQAEAYGKSSAGAADNIAVSFGNINEAWGEFVASRVVLSDTAHDLNLLADEGLGAVFTLDFWNDSTKEIPKVAIPAAASIDKLALAQERLAGATQEATDATAAQQDAELAKLRADENVTQAQKNLADTIKEHGKGSREAKIAALELKVAQREAAAAAANLKQKVDELNAANQRVAKEKALQQITADLEALRKKLDGTAGAASRFTSKMRELNAVKNGGRNTGGVMMASGGILAPQTGGVQVTAAEAGYPESFITWDPRHRDRSLAILEQTAQALGASAGSSSGTVINITGSRTDAAWIAAQLRSIGTAAPLPSL